MSLYYAVAIEGLRNPLSTTDPASVLFVYGDTTSLTLPLALTSSRVLPLLDSNDPGEGWSSDLRKPISSGGEQAIRILDTPDGALGKILLFDPAEATWDVSVSVLAAGALSVQVSGPTPPPLGFYWVEEECIEITAVAIVAMGGGTSALSYNLTISRGQCGSRDRTHFINPAAISPSEDGTEERLTLWPRPNFGAYRFRGTMYLLESAFSANPATIVEARHFFIDEEPLAGIPAYELHPKDVAEAMEHHTWHLAKSVQLPYRIFVNYEGADFVSMPMIAHRPPIATRKVPAACVLYLDRLRAWQLFSSPLGEVGQPGFSTSLLSDLRTRLGKGGNKIRELIKLTTRSEQWLFVASNPRLPPNPVLLRGDPVIIVDLTLIDYTKGSSLDTEPDESSNQSSDGYDTDDYSNQVFTRLLADNLRPPRVPLSEDPPTLEFWYQLNMTPIEAYLYTTTSNGGYSADPYDALIGVGLGIPSDWQNRGAAPANPLTAPWGTTELLALNGLLSETYTYYLKAGDRLGDFLANLCTLHTLIHAPLTTGELMLRRFARPIDAGPISVLDPDISQPVAPGERLTPLRAFLLYSGIKTLTLEPEFVRSISLGGPANRATGAPVSVRVWQPGNQLTDEQIQQGTIGHLLRAFFSLMGGAPIRYSVPCHVLRQNLQPGDFVLWSDDRIPTPQGRGFTGIRFVVVGADLNYKTGIKVYRLLRDYYNELPQSVGQIAPTLSHPLPSLNGLSVTLTVGSQGDASFDATTAHGGIWASLLAGGGYVRVVSPDFHNPTDQNDGAGWGEAYGQINGVRFDPGTN